MAFVFIDETDEGLFAVRVMSGARGDKTKSFHDLKEARGFAWAKAGARGVVADTTSMTPEQLKALRERQARQAAALKSVSE